jgi:hypothetical protein
MVLLLLALVAAVALIWVPPLLAGPTISCTVTDQASCDDMARAAVADSTRTFPIGALLPVTNVEILDSCGSYVVTRILGIASIAFNDFCE